MNLLLQFVFLVIGFVMLIKGADWFVEGASKVAGKFGILAFKIFTAGLELIEPFTVGRDFKSKWKVV